MPAAVLLVSLFAGCKQQEHHAPDVWAVVNGTEIKRDEVEKYYRTRINPEAQETSPEEVLSGKLNVVEQLINNEILLERAKKQNLEASDGEVEDKFTELKSGYTEDEFQRKLKDGGMSVDDLKKDLRRQLSIQKLLNREVAAKVTITDQDVLDFYNTNRNQFNVAEPQYRISQIVITPRKDQMVRNRKNDDATNDAEAERKAKMLEDKLNSGADFSQLAMDYSEDPNTAATGGDLGYIPESSLNAPQTDPVLKRMVLGLKPGQVSPPIQLKDSIRILKLVAREAAGQRGVNDPQVQQMVRDTLRNRKEQLLRNAYLAVARDEAHVTNYLAIQVIETAGKLPDASKTSPPRRLVVRRWGYLSQRIRSSHFRSSNQQLERFFHVDARIYPDPGKKYRRALTGWPSLACKRSTRPFFGERISFCIFMASTTMSPWPTSTSSPTFTSKRITLPGIGATICCRPSASSATLFSAPPRRADHAHLPEIREPPSAVCRCRPERVRCEFRRPRHSESPKPRSALRELRRHRPACPSRETLYEDPSFSRSTMCFVFPPTESRCTSNFMAGDPPASAALHFSSEKARSTHHGRRLQRYRAECSPSTPRRWRRQLPYRVAVALQEGADRASN